MRDCVDDGPPDGPSRSCLWTLSTIQQRRLVMDGGNRKHFPASLRRRRRWRTIHPGGVYRQAASNLISFGVQRNTGTALSSNFTVRRPGPLGDTVFSSINPRQAVRGGAWRRPSDPQRAMTAAKTADGERCWTLVGRHCGLLYWLAEGTNRVTCEGDICSWHPLCLLGADVRLRAKCRHPHDGVSYQHRPTKIVA